MLSRHVNPSWVTGYVIGGAWGYLEHDWLAREGAFAYEDVFTTIAMCRKHYAACGLGEGFVDQFVR